MATTLPETGIQAETAATARDCGLASVLIGGLLIVAVGIGFLLNWQLVVHARSMFSRSDTAAAVALTAISAALLIWAAVTGLRLSGRAPAGLAGAARTLNIVALIHVVLYIFHAAMIFANL